MKNIQLTPEFILNQFSHTYNLEGLNANIECDSDNYFWVKLAMDTLDIEYTDNEYYDDECGVVRFLKGKRFNAESVSNVFTFKLEDIRIECPKLYKQFECMKTEKYNKLLRKDKLEKLIK